jgi:hypothetical protein
MVDSSFWLDRVLAFFAFIGQTGPSPVSMIALTIAIEMKLNVAAVTAVNIDHIAKSVAMDFLKPNLSDIQPPGKLKSA